MSSPVDNGDRRSNVLPIVLNAIGIGAWVMVILALFTVSGPDIDGVPLDGTIFTILRLLVIAALSLIYAFLLLLANKFALQNRDDGSAHVIQRNAFGIATLVFAVVIAVMAASGA